MTPDRQTLLKQAMQLSPDDRVCLAQDLWDTLKDPSFAPEIEAAWMEEIRRRVDAYERGETQAVDVEEAFARIERKIESRKIAARKAAG